jgi:O-antigen/teichoic acid export membrane protein
VKLAALVAKMAGFVGARVIGAGLGFASQLVLARILPQEAVGIVLLGMSAAAFLSLLANGGYSLFAMTELPKLTAHGRSHLANAFNQVAVVDSLLMCLVLCGLGWGLAQAVGLSAGQKTALMMGIICAPASLAIRYNASIASAAKYFKTAYMPDFLFRPAALLMGLAAGAWLGWVASDVAALVVFVIVTYLTAAVMAWALKGQGISIRHFSWSRAAFAKRIRARAFSLTLVSATMLAFADIVVVVAGFILPEREVAIVGIAMRLAAIAGFVLQAGQMLVMTDFTQALVRGENEVVNSLLKRTNFITVGIVVAGLFGAMFLGDFALGLFGESYRSGKWLLVLFMVGQSIRALGGMNQQILSINGYQLRTAGSCLLALVVLVCLSILLCKSLGFMGLGYAVIGAELVWLVALAVQSASLCGRRGDLLWVLAHR